ncbi:hypothetical protein ANO11243_066770 [Dothideomycetidae sp. 11243]|nr:hypothetical protein ANO11243_066770 [fungal sp. No.11243]
MKPTNILVGLLASTVAATQGSNVCNETTKQITKHVANDAFFCRSYLGASRKLASLPGQTAAETVKSCEWILKKAKVHVPAANSGGGSIVPKASTVQCSKKELSLLKKEFSYVKALCHYMEGLSKTKGKTQPPAPGMSVKQVMEGCKCLMPSSPSTSTGTTTADATTSESATASLEQTSTDVVTTTSASTSASSTSLPYGCPLVPTQNITYVFDQSQTATYTVVSSTTGSYISHSATATATTFALNQTDIQDAVQSCATVAAEAVGVGSLGEFNLLWEDIADVWSCQAWVEPTNATESFTDGFLVGCSYFYQEA